MRHFLCSSCISAVVLWAGAAAAEPATEAGATRLKQVFQTYTGRTEGVVAVAPDGDAYEVTLDFAPLASRITTGGELVQVSPILLRITEQGGGLWGVTLDQPLEVTVSLPGQLDMAVKVGKLSSEGVFDAALAAFTSSRTVFSGLDLNQTMANPELGDTTVRYTIEQSQYETTATAAAEGGVDLVASYGLTGLTEVFGMQGFDEYAPPTDATLRAESYTATAKITGLRADALYRLMAFLVAHPSEAAITADQAGFKAALAAGLPLFHNIMSDGAITAISLDTPFGAFGLDELGIVVETNGLVSDGLVREAFRAEGLALPADMVPEWAADLVPDSFAIDVKLARFDLASPMAMFLEAVDLAASEPVDDAMSTKLMAALLPDGVVDISVAPGHLTSGIYDIAFEGTMSAGPTGDPTGKATVTAKGVSAVEQTLAGAPADVGAEIASYISIARAMSAAGPDGALVWEIDATTPGSVLVNGVDVAGGAQ